MPTYWCYLYNNTSNFLKVHILSPYGQGLYYLWPGQGQWVQWYPGQKVMTLFDGSSGAFLYSYTFTVSGPGTYTVIGSMSGGTPYSVQFGPSTGNAPTSGHNATS
jgi:hypothetical protein